MTAIKQFFGALGSIQPRALHASVHAMLTTRQWAHCFCSSNAFDPSGLRLRPSLQTCCLVTTPGQTKSSHPFCFVKKANQEARPKSRKQATRQGPKQESSPRSSNDPSISLYVAPDNLMWPIRKHRNWCVAFSSLVVANGLRHTYMASIDKILRRVLPSIRKSNLQALFLSKEPNEKHLKTHPN